MKSQDIRTVFLEYFRKKDHRVFKSASLIPENDPTLLFNVAGMVQFKPMFEGLVKFDYKSAASIQKCLRVGDLEEVGKSPFHDTFFEMLGNFSFNDYFQKEAIKYAWEFLTDIVNVDSERLYVTVHKDDDNAYEIWAKDIGIEKNRIIRLGDETNFWGPAGGTGACGPSSEIFYDFGVELENKSPCTIENDCMRYKEIWNLVFPQYNQDIYKVRHPLKNKGIDTGMGLERLAAILQNKKSIYETDLFMPIIEDMLNMHNYEYDKFRVEINSIADHVRAITFAIADGIIPENDGRGYVVRRILRRAVRIAYKMGIQEPFLYKLSSSVINIMNEQYDYLNDQSLKVSTIIKAEEERFLSTIGQGVALYGQYIDKHSSDTLSGDIMFKLYDTFGFPLDLTCQMAAEDNLKTDIKGFNLLLKEAQERSRKNTAFISSEKSEWKIIEEDVSIFKGYEKIECNSSVLMYRESGQSLEIIFKETPFYAMSGGQSGDSGIAKGENQCCLSVSDTIKSDLGNVCIANVKEGNFDPNIRYNLQVDREKRKLTERNHTATHILHSALRYILGDHVHQEGSYVGPEKLRFDFSHYSHLSETQLRKVEEYVNKIISHGIVLNTNIMDYKQALKEGATALFSEKYNNSVRVVSVGSVSKELCGGTHVSNTAEIGVFKVLSESSVAAGIRRIEALTSESALNMFIDELNVNKTIRTYLNVKSNEEILKKLEHIVEEKKSMEKTLRKYEHNTLKDIISEINEHLYSENERMFIAHIIDSAGIKQQQLREIMDNLKSEYNNISGFIGAIDHDKLHMIAFSADPLINAETIIKAVSKMIKGKGGGRKDMAMGSGNIPLNIDEFIRNVRELFHNENRPD